MSYSTNLGLPGSTFFWMSMFTGCRSGGGKCDKLLAVTKKFEYVVMGTMRDILNSGGGDNDVEK